MDDTKPESTNPSNAPQSGSRGKAYRGWWLFLLVLIAPAVLTLLTAKSENPWSEFTLLPSVIAGVYCGFWVSFRTCKTMVGKILGGLAMTFVFIAGSLTLCWVGCAIGVSLNVH